jgi:hypothetical protein
MATTSKERSLIMRLTAQKRRAEIVGAAMYEFALGEFDGSVATVIALRASGAADRRLRPLLAQQAMPSMAAAMDLPGAWS